MTDPEMVGENGSTYVEPITPEVVAKIIENERAKYPQEKMAVLPTMGGQTALNTALALEAGSAREALLIGASAYFDAMVEPGRTRLLLLEAPAVLGLESVVAID